MRICANGQKRYSFPQKKGRKNFVLFLFRITTPRTGTLPTECPLSFSSSPHQTEAPVLRVIRKSEGCPFPSLFLSLLIFYRPSLEVVFVFSASGLLSPGKAAPPDQKNGESGKRTLRIIFTLKPGNYARQKRISAFLPDCARFNRFPAPKSPVWYRYPCVSATDRFRTCFGSYGERRSRRKVPQIPRTRQDPTGSAPFCSAWE